MTLRRNGARIENVRPKGLKDILEKKRKLFKCAFGDKYSLRLLDLQVWNNKDGRTLSEVSFIFGAKMTALGIQSCCEKIARWMGGELFGTVNLDFSGNAPSLEMMVELQG